MRTLRLLNLHCRKTDDIDDNNNTKVNETILTVDNGKFQGFGPESMVNGSDWKVNADIQFNEKAIIGFYDDDLILHLSNNIKYISTHIVEENEVIEGQKKVNFTSDNANYIFLINIYQNNLLHKFNSLLNYFLFVFVFTISLTLFLHYRSLVCN